MDKALLINKAPLAAAVALTMGMLASFGLQGYRIWQQNNETLAPAGAAANNQAPQAAVHEATDLVNGHLFGQPLATQQPQAVQTENLPTTNLKLTLRGVSASPSEKLASALVEGPDQQTQVYVIGDQLPGDAVLRAVYANRIVIERRGRLENLYFPEDSEGSSAISSYSDYPSNEAADSGYQDYSPEYTQEYAPDSTYQPDQAPATEPVQEIVPQQTEEPPVVYEAPPVEEPQPPVEVQEPQADPTSEPAYVLDALSEERKQEIRERLQRLREQIINQ